MGSRGKGWLGSKVGDGRVRVVGSRGRGVVG